MMISLNSSLYNVASNIQNNATLNRAVMETGGVEVPFSIMANNRDERIERILRAFLFVGTSFIAPVITMPLLNKIFLKNGKLIQNKLEKNVLMVSKKYLSKDVQYMKEGFKKTAEELKTKNHKKYENIDKVFDNFLERFTDKELLRNKLAKAHNKIFIADFLIASAAAIAVPWGSNYITEKRTKRAGFVGEFKLADNAYTDDQTKKHQQNKKNKLLSSFAIPILAVAGLSKLHINAMLKPNSKINALTRLMKRNIHKLDYQDSIFMSKAGYMALMFAGDMPAYLLACRDKHELKMRVTIWSFMISMMYGGEFLLNNIAGRILDKKLGTTLMDKVGFEDSGFLKKFKMEVQSLSKLKTIKDTSKLTKKLAFFMYIGNFVLTTIGIGFGISALTNKNLRNDVKKDLEKKKMISTNLIDNYKAKMNLVKNQ